MQLRKRRKVVIRKISVILSAIDVPLYGSLMMSNANKEQEIIVLVLVVLLKLLLIYLEYRWAIDTKIPPAEKE